MNSIKKISQTIVTIDDTLNRIHSHPEYSTSLRNCIIRQMLKESARHSQSLEDSADQGIVSVRPESSENHRRLREAWDYLTKHDLNIASLSQIGRIVEPKKNPAGFRQEIIQIGSSEKEWESIYDDIDSMLWRMKNLKIRHNSKSE